MDMDFTGKSVLITGGTGSFGNTFLRYLLERSCKEIRILSRDELKQDEMRTQINDSRVRFYLGDVRSRDSIDEAFPGVDYVFHAAALKQVPSCDFFPGQAVLTNVIGSENVIRASIEHRVQRVVCLSTDKAVYPINAMGMTKALMEKLVCAYSRSTNGTILSCVRY